MSTDAAEQDEDCELGLAEVLRDEHRYLSAYRKLGERDGEAGTAELAENATLADCQKALNKSGAAALCFSGGGVRSATFCLGVMQGLASLGLLHRFDYLSTVSGGGYIGGWLSSWSFRAGGAQQSEARLNAEAPAGLKPRTGEAPTPLQWLRNYSNYLAPKGGLISVDTWTLVTTYVRNLLIVWMALAPPLMLVLFLPRLMYQLLAPDDSYAAGTVLWMTASLAATGLVLLGVGEANSYRFEKDSGGGDTPMTYVYKVNVPYTLGAIALALAWVVSPKTGIESGIVPAAVFAMIAGATVIGILSEWNPPPGGGLRAALRANGQDIVACLLQALAMLFTFTALLAATTGSFPEPAEWQFVVYPVAMLAAMGTGDLFYAAFLSRRSTDVDRERWARSAAWFAILGFGWLAWSALALLAPLALRLARESTTALHVANALVAAVLGVVLARIGLSDKTNAQAGPAQSGAAQKYLVPAAMVLFVVLVLALLSSGNVWLETWVNNRDPSGELQSWFRLHLGEEDFERLNDWGLRCAVPVLLITACVLVLRGININQFSLHAMYRDRLIRAYLGATRPPTASDVARFDDAPKAAFSRFTHGAEYRRRWIHQGQPRAANPHTGFDDADNLDLFWLGLYRNQPLWIVNMALNIVDNRNHLSWQERKAASFTASPLHCGAWLTGYRHTWAYGGREGGISAGTAVAISGAAANPNMGYHSSPAMTFLLTFFNARLGWWLGNPGGRQRHGDAHRSPSPRNGLFQLLKELFGKTDDRSDWIHLSDGGHFENLGLYEMCVRRCQYIVVCDAGADPKREFGDLGNAIRKIRIDLDVYIEPEPNLRPIGPRNKDDAAGHTMFKIRYPGGLAGKLLYIKPSVYPSDGELPRDVAQYASTSSAFPHESTVDQFFSESQFESYRALGAYQLQCGALRDLPETERNLHAAFDRADRNARQP